MRNRGGWTLWELLFSLLVLSALFALAAPGFERFVLDAKRTADINGFVTSIQLARSESAKRAANVVLCKTADIRTCGGAELRYDGGWMVFINADDDQPPTLGSADTLLHFHAPAMQGTIVSNRKLYEFRPFRRRSTNGTITFCDERGSAAARAVIVSYTGRPRVSDRGPGNRVLVCLTV